jgi:hypothetical protein
MDLLIKAIEGHFESRPRLWPAHDEFGPHSTNYQVWLKKIKRRSIQTLPQSPLITLKRIRPCFRNPLHN